MARFSGGARATGAGSTTLPSGSIYAAAGSGGSVRAIGVWNTEVTEVAIRIVRLSTAGTSSALTLGKLNPNKAAAACTVRNVHSGTAPTISEDLGYRAMLGAAIGSGVMFTFGDDGLVIPAGTGNGIGIITATGTGRVLDYFFEWDE